MLKWAVPRLGYFWSILRSRPSSSFGEALLSCVVCSDCAGFEGRPELPNCADDLKAPKAVAGRCYCKTAATRLYVGVENMVVEFCTSLHMPSTPSTKTGACPRRMCAATETTG
eukprot:1188290-Prorocentrum_minimum.AAC.1